MPEGVLLVWRVLDLDLDLRVHERFHGHGRACRIVSVVAECRVQEELELVGERVRGGGGAASPLAGSPDLLLVGDRV